MEISKEKIGFTAQLKAAYIASRETYYDRSETFPLECHAATVDAVRHLESGGKDTGILVTEVNDVLVVVTESEANKENLKEVTTKLCGNRWVKANVLTLRDYIDLNFEGSQRAFATAQGVQPPQVTQWLDKDFIVINDKLYSHRRDLNT